MVKSILYLSVFFWLLNEALVYGCIWHSQAYPSHNVTVNPPGGSPRTGTLYRDWDKSWVIEDSDGHQTRFNDPIVITTKINPRWH